MADTLKVIELLAESNKGWEHAVETAVAKAGLTLHNIKSVYVENFSAEVVKNKVTAYRVNVKISFLLD